MHLLLRATFLLRLGDVVRVDACERHPEYSRVVHGLSASRSLALLFRPRSRSEPNDNGNDGSGRDLKILAPRDVHRSEHIFGESEVASILRRCLAAYLNPRISSGLQSSP